jgi:hypothetical protein
LPQKVTKGAKMKTQKEIFQLCDQVRETAFTLHCYLKHGHLEKVYENGLANRLRKLGVRVDFGSGKLEVRKFVLSDAV